MPRKEGWGGESERVCECLDHTLGCLKAQYVWLQPLTAFRVSRSPKSVTSSVSLAHLFMKDVLKHVSPLWLTFFFQNKSRVSKISKSIMKVFH